MIDRLLRVISGYEPDAISPMETWVAIEATEAQIYRARKFKEFARHLEDDEMASRYAQEEEMLKRLLAEFEVMTLQYSEVRGT